MRITTRPIMLGALVTLALGASQVALLAEVSPSATVRGSDFPVTQAFAP